MKFTLTLLALTLSMLSLAGCTEKQEQTARPAQSEQLSLMLDYFPNADHVGIYAAMAMDKYKAVGLEVTPQTPSDPSAPLKLLAAGKVDVAISYEPELLLARDQGLDLVAIGAVVQKPLTALISLAAADIQQPSDLAGKRVGTAGIPYQSEYLRTIVQHAGLSPTAVEEINVGYNLNPALLSRKVDAVLGSYWNYEAIELKQRGKEVNVLRMDQVGIPTYDELIFVTRRSDVKAKSDRLRRFLQATAAGYRITRKDPALAVNALLKANPDLQHRLQTAAVQATIPAFFPTNAELPFGFQNPGEWELYGRWMYRSKLVRNPPVIRAAMTNTLLQGKGGG